MLIDDLRKFAECGCSQLSPGVIDVCTRAVELLKQLRVEYEEMLKCEPYDTRSAVGRKLRDLVESA